VERRLGVAEVRTHEPFNGIGHGEPGNGWGEGNAKIIKAGSKLVLQIHYHPSGKVEKDRSPAVYRRRPNATASFDSRMNPEIVYSVRVPARHFGTARPTLYARASCSS
jgi:hypothetical protein